MHICICIKSLPGGAPTEYQRLLTRPFYQHANEIYARFEDRKDINRFYFISLFLEMTYSNNGIVSELAPDPVAGGPSCRTPSTIRGCPSVTRLSSLSDTWTHPLAAAWVWKDIVIVVGVALRPFPVGSSEEWLCGSSLLTTKSDTASTSCFKSTLNLQPSTNCRRG